MEAAEGADLLIHECFQSPAVFARATGLPLETALNITRLGPHGPRADGQDPRRCTQPRMGALWHLDLTPGVDTVFEELGAHYQGPVTITQDFTVFNVTEAGGRRSPGEGERCRAARARSLEVEPGARSEAGPAGVVGRRPARRLTEPIGLPLSLSRR